MSGSSFPQVTSLVTPPLCSPTTPVTAQRFSSPEFLGLARRHFEAEIIVCALVAFATFDKVN
jgi:hypothetical protein